MMYDFFSKKDTKYAKLSHELRIGVPKENWKPTKISDIDDFTYFETYSFGNFRVQHYNGIVEFVSPKYQHDYDNVKIFLGMNIEFVKKYVINNSITKEEVELNESNERENILKRDQERILYYEEERKKRIIWESEHWVCMEGGEGYYH